MGRGFLETQKTETGGDNFFPQRVPANSSPKGTRLLKRRGATPVFSKKGKRENRPAWGGGRAVDQRIGENKEKGGKKGGSIAGMNEKDREDAGGKKLASVSRTGGYRFGK